MAQIDDDSRAYVLGGDVALLSTAADIGEERFYTCPVAEASRSEVRRVLVMRRRLRDGDRLEDQLAGERPSKVLRDAIDLAELELSRLRDAQAEVRRERARALADANARGAGGGHG